MRRTWKVAGLALAGCAWVLPAAAVDWEFSGFGSAVVGRTYGDCDPRNTLATAYASACTRYVADWGHAGIYTDRWSARPESRLGVQASGKFDTQWSFTGQAVARGAGAPYAAVEWAYVSYQPTPEWTLQAGRKRLPLFYYSDFQDVGYAYPWLRVPPDVYGWDIVNFNGASAAYNTLVGGWTLRSSVFGGAETSRKNQYMRVLYDPGIDVHWTKIAGADLELGRDWLTARVVYMRAGYHEIDRATATPNVQPSGDTHSRHQAWGGSINIDYGNFLARSEYSVFDRSRYSYKAVSWFVSGGWRIGNFTPMLTASHYAESTKFPAVYGTARWSTRSVSVRYELGKSSAVKLQFDRLRDNGATTLPGHAKVLAASYDFVF